MKPEPPEAFLQFALSFHQDILVIYPSLQDAADDYVSDMQRSDLVAIDGYLTALLGSEDNRNSLKNMWRKAGSSIAFHDTKSVQAFLAYVQEKVRARLIEKR